MVHGHQNEHFVTVNCVLMRQLNGMGTPLNKGDNEITTFKRVVLGSVVCLRIGFEKLGE